MSRLIYLIFGLILVLTVAACSDRSIAPTTSVAEPTSVAPSASPRLSSSPTTFDVPRLVIPPKVKGELSRVVFQNGRAVGTTSASATSRRAYALEVACTARTAGASMNYEVVNMESSDAEPSGQGEVTCDGNIHQPFITELRGRFQIQLTGLKGVKAGYAVLAPARG